MGEAGQADSTAAAIEKAEKEINGALNARGKRKKKLKEIKLLLDFIRANYGEDTKRCSDPSKAKLGAFRNFGGQKEVQPVIVPKKLRTGSSDNSTAENLEQIAKNPLK